MNDPRFIQEMREAVQALKQAKTRADVGRAYQALVGYDSAKEDPNASMYALGSLLVDYLCEGCYSLGIHVSVIGLEPGNVSSIIEGFQQ